MSYQEKINNIYRDALAEDLGTKDVTTAAIFEEAKNGQADIVAKQSGIVAGIASAREIFRLVDNLLQVSIYVEDGNAITPNGKVMTLHGKIASILIGERTALNFLAHLSGIATLTSEFVKKISGTNTKITDTRKTTPLLRSLEKAAVRAGGGINHRMGLYDMILIKENHIRAAGDIAAAIYRAKKYNQNAAKKLKIEIETTTLAEVRTAIEGGVDRIMLDNMELDQIKQAVKLIDGRAEVEASGGVNLQTVESIASSGVDYISVGALTHSAKAFDYSLLLYEE
jgi:nicotinate-nucleotide pyrophosphorylase (carboxylating)